MKGTATLLLVLLAGCATSPVAPAGADAALVDPNCQVNVVAGQAIPNYGGPPSNAQQSDSTNAISQLGFADLYRNPPFSINGPANRVRLDVQGVIPGNGRNWQVQINGVNGNSTIAAMLIDGTLANATGANQAFVQRSARSALVQSLNTHNIYRVTGTCN
jgi:hypothetical protein